MAQRGKRYTQEEKENALDLAENIGYANAAARLNIAFQTLYTWKHQKAKHMLEPQEMTEPPTNFVKKLPKKTETVSKQAPAPPEPIKPVPDTREFNRGEIYYIDEFPTVGGEQHSGRPAVIISNNKINKNLTTVEIVWLTTKINHVGPEYTIIKSSGRLAKALCSKITTIDKSKIGAYNGEVTPEEMERIEQCILNSFDMDKYNKNQITDEQIISRLQVIKSERDAYEKLYNKLFERFLQECRQKP